MNKKTKRKLKALKKRIAALEVEAQKRQDFSQGTKEKLRDFLCEELSFSPL